MVEQITAVCTASVFEAGRVRRRLRFSGLTWTENRRWLQVHFIATGTRLQWENEYRRGGSHDPMFRAILDDR